MPSKQRLREAIAQVHARMTPEERERVAQRLAGLKQMLEPQPSWFSRLLRRFVQFRKS